MDVYHLKITLQDVRTPVVWRRIRIPSKASFDALHAAIQGAMGWFDSHLYEFTDVRNSWDYGHDWSIVNLADWGDGEGVEDALDSCETAIDQYLKKEGDQIMYTYDMGDSWRHTILLEKITTNTIPTIACTGGRGACSPEDVGGVGGYEEMKRIFKEEPRSEEAKSYKRWLGLRMKDVFDPTYFSQAEANEKIREFFY